MGTWTSDELDRISGSDELEIAGRRDDGTLRKPVPIWVVRLGDDLYVRSVNGPQAGWFRGVQQRHEGHIRAAGVDRDVGVEPAAGLDEQLDEAYRRKYARYPEQIVNSILTPQARSTSTRVAPLA